MRSFLLALATLFGVASAQHEDLGGWIEQTGQASWDARKNVVAVKLSDDSILLLGGSNAEEKNMKEVWKSVDEGKSWTAQATPAEWTNQPNFAAVASSSDTVYIMGGGSIKEGLYDNEVWKSTDEGKSWTKLSNGGWVARAKFGAVVVSDAGTEKIVVMGGDDGSGGFGPRNDVWSWAPGSSRWNEVSGDAPWPKRRGLAAVSGGNNIYLMGGVGDDGSGGEVLLNDVWMSTDAGGTWSQKTGNAEWSKRKDFAALVLANGDLVIMGGQVDSGVSSEVWRSSNSGASWTKVSNPSYPGPSRYSFAAVRLDSGQIVVSGGSDGSSDLRDVWATLCQPGYFRDDSTSMCQECAAGKFQAEKGQTKCNDCKKGEYQPNMGSTGCDKCAAGKFGDKTGADSETDCESCQAGKFSDKPGSASCTNCAKGKYEVNTGMEECTGLCPAGNSGKIEGGSSEVDACAKCNGGTYQPQKGQANCNDCPLGTFDPREGREVCGFWCPPGTHGEQTGRTSEGDACQDCAAGQYMPYFSSARCLSCEVGSYSESRAMYQCKLCPTGTYGIALGKDSKEAACQKCPAGKFSDEMGSQSCKICSVGKTTENEGLTSCADCSAGKYGAEEGRCTGCPQGHVQPNTGETMCTPCPVGHVTGDGKSCTPCPAGTYATSGDTIECVECPVGLIQPKTGQTSCTACPAGNVTANGISCKSCQQGMTAISNKCVDLASSFLSGASESGTSGSDSNLDGWALFGMFMAGFFACLVVGGATVAGLRSKGWFGGGRRGDPDMSGVRMKDNPVGGHSAGP